MSLFGLPSLWVYVTFEDGTIENVANSDSLSKEEAESYKENWEKWKKKKVHIVGLYSRNMEKCYKEYSFDGVK